jgi:hypothetical protein
MSEYSHEHEPGVLTDDSVPVVVADRDAGPAPYAMTGPAPSAASPQTQGPPADVKDAAKEAGQHVAEVAKDQAGNVAAEAKHQAKDLLDQGRDELRQQTAQQQDRVASGLHSLSAELHSMASGSSDQGMAADLAREAADRARAMATWLEEREPGQLLDEVTSFARRRPGAFLGIAAAAGVVVGRLGRGLKEGEPQPARHAAADQPRRSSQPSVDPLARTAGIEPAYGGPADPAGYGSTVADPVVDIGSDRGRLP